MPSICSLVPPPKEVKSAVASNLKKKKQMRQFLEKIRATHIDQHHDPCQGQKIEQDLLDDKEMLRPKSNAAGNDTSPTNQIDNQPN